MIQCVALNRPSGVHWILPVRHSAHGAANGDVDEVDPRDETCESRDSRPILLRSGREI